MVQPIKIYVGNVPSSARNSELKELFEKFGKVVECDILKEFAFVHMDDTNDAKAAIAGLNDSLWKGSRIRVELSTTKTSKGEPSLKHRSGGGGPPPSASHHHYMSNDLARHLRRRSNEREHRRAASPPSNSRSRSTRDSRELLARPSNGSYDRDYEDYPAYRNGASRSAGPIRDSRYSDMPSLNGRPYPVDRSRPPYPDMFDQRSGPRGYMSSSSRNGLHPSSSSRNGTFPPEYPFHPASYARGNEMSMRESYRGGMPAAAAYHDPYLRGPYGAQPPPPPHPSYFRAPGSRYEYEQYPPLPPPRNSRYASPPLNSRDSYANNYSYSPPSSHRAPRPPLSPPPPPPSERRNGTKASNNKRHHTHSSSPSPSRTRSRTVSPPQRYSKPSNGKSSKANKSANAVPPANTSICSSRSSRSVSRSSGSRSSSRSRNNTSNNSSFNEKTSKKASKSKRSRKEAKLDPSCKEDSRENSLSDSPSKPQLQASCVKVVNKKEALGQRKRVSSSRSRSRSSN